MTTKRFKVATMIVTVFLAACGSDGSVAAPTEQVSSTEVVSTTAGASPPVTTSPLATEAAPITVANVSDLVLVEEYADYVWLDFTPDGDSIAMQGDKLALLDWASGEIQVLVDEVIDQNYVTAISPNGRYILYVTKAEDASGVSRVWDVEAGENIVDMQSAGAGAVFLANSGDLIVAGTGLYWMDVAALEVVEHGIEPRSTSDVIELMPDGTTLVTSSNGYLVFDSTESGEEIKVWDFTEVVDGTTFAPTVTGVSASQDGTLVAVGVMDANHPELNAIHIIDYATDEPLHVIQYELAGQTPALRQVALSPDGTLLVAVFQEDLLRGGHLEAFNVASGESITVIPVEGAVQRVTFSPDGTLLAVGTTKRSGLKLFGVAE